MFPFKGSNLKRRFQSSPSNSNVLINRKSLTDIIHCQYLRLNGEVSRPKLLYFVLFLFQDFVDLRHCNQRIRKYSTVQDTKLSRGVGDIRTHYLLFIDIAIIV